MLMGLSCNLALAGCDLPIMSEEVVTQDVRASAVAGQQMTAGLVGAFGASIVGLLAQEAYGYEQTNADIDTMDPVLKKSNMLALGKSCGWGSDCALDGQCDHRAVHVPYIPSRSRCCHCS